MPPGFSLFNSNQAVLAFGPDKSRIIFDRAPKPADGSMEYYLGRVWGAKLQLQNLETIKVNGLDAATATAQVRTNEGNFDARLVAYRVDQQTIYRMMFLTPGNQTARLSTEMRRTTYSFRRLSAAEASQLRPLVLRIVQVRSGDTVQSLAQQMPYADFKIERFEVLNGISRDDRLQPGQKLKMVTTN